MSKRKKVFRSFEEIERTYFPKRYAKRNDPQPPVVIIIGKTFPG